MRAQVPFTPSESRKLIANAIAPMDYPKRAAKCGMAVLHPSGSTHFVVEETGGRLPGGWVEKSPPTVE